MSITLPSTPSFRLDGRRALVAGAGRGIGSAAITLPSTPSFRLDGRRALVAGAGRGIGSAAAAALAEAGAAVTLAARSRNELDAVALAIRARGGRADVLPGFLEVVTSKIALGRIGKLEDIMGAVVFLASDASALVTGSALMADGGWTAA